MERRADFQTSDKAPASEVSSDGPLLITRPTSRWLHSDRQNTALRSPAAHIRHLTARGTFFNNTLRIHLHSEITASSLTHSADIYHVPAMSSILISTVTCRSLWDMVPNLISLGKRSETRERGRTLVGTP